MKIVVAEKISEAAMRLFRDGTGWTVITPDEFAQSPEAALRDADALIVRSAVQADKKLIEHAPALRIIGRAGVGVDNVDQEFATRRGIVVMNTPGANAVAVAELTLGLMLCLARSIPRAAETMRAGKWEKKTLQGTELSGKTLGIIGLGRIGIEVARRAAAMKMDVIAYDPYVAPKIARDLEVTLADLDEVYAQADYLSLHLGLSERTLRLIDADAIAKMKKGVRIVNCARGELIDDVALAAALEAGKVAGAALDVFSKEPPHDNPLLATPNVIATPHIAGSTAEAQEAVGVQIARQVTEYLRNSIVQNAVNVPSLTDVEFRRLSPYIELSERLGKLTSQLIVAQGNLEEIAISYRGEIGDEKTALLRSSVVQGVLQAASSEPVNMVNAQAHAQERGIAIKESKGAAEQAASEIEVVLRTSTASVQARGAVVHGSSPRISVLDGIEVECPLSGHLLVMRNRDLPGVIGTVGGLLGEAQINIARFVLGREAQQASAARSQAPSATATQAIAIIQTDTPVDEPVLRRIRQLPAVLDVRSVSFS